MYHGSQKNNTILSNKITEETQAFTLKKKIENMVENKVFKI